ncbi:hypothetical protein H7I53_04080 [Mycolicibacterium pulveris]|uniref:hypothetical protein n=1 Tax=Mycolicibacterium pulveris TaxID=36813 RepID=UPI0013D6809B|nr:hypothetical protein [Mycolicibacterium pulveris]MCV6979407.1 hypothetical protein [Mycolicibacterium pulveris]
MFTRRALLAGLAAVALASAVTLGGFGVDAPASTAQPWGPHCWWPDSTWNPACGQMHPDGPWMGEGHHGPGMGHGHGPGMGHGPWGPAGW